MLKTWKDINEKAEHTCDKIAEVQIRMNEEM